MPGCFDAPCSVPLMSVPTMPSVHTRILDPLTDITIRRVPRAPCLHHDTSSDVSDSHSVASHPVCPSRALSRIRHQPHACPMHRHRCRARAQPGCPFDAPCSVPTMSNRPCPQTHTPAPRSPAVIATRRVPRAPCPTMHLIDVSDSHSVASHPVCPSRALSRIRHQPHARPMHRHRCRARAQPGCPFDAPCSVPPCTSIDQALRLMLPHLDPLPSSPPVGCPELRVPPCTSSMSPTPTPSPRILSVPPEPCPVYATSPMLAPCTVTDAEPVPSPVAPSTRHAQSRHVPRSTMPSDSHSRTSIPCRHHHPSGAPSSVSHHAPHRCLRLPLRRLAS